MDLLLLLYVILRVSVMLDDGPSLKWISDKKWNDLLTTIQNHDPKFSEARDSMKQSVISAFDICFPDGVTRSQLIPLLAIVIALENERVGGMTPRRVDRTVQWRQLCVACGSDQQGFIQEVN